MNHILLLASDSASRKLLLSESKIPFTVIGHGADETEVDHPQPLESLVLAIARHKMNHAKLPVGQEGDTIFVLTADTLGHNSNGVISGKPRDRQDAREKIKNLTPEYTTMTAFCLEKKQYRNGGWHTISSIEQVVGATYSFSIPSHWIDRYFDNSWGLSASGAIAIENYGQQFLKSLNGSYSTIMGLPMFELREALEDIGFF